MLEDSFIIARDLAYVSPALLLRLHYFSAILSMRYCLAQFFYFSVTRPQMDITAIPSKSLQVQVHDLNDDGCLCFDTLSSSYEILDECTD